jgi:hypothetical protein
MLNQLNKDLRQAERDMFSGKTEKAIAALDPIRELFGQVKEADPNNPAIKTLESKYKKLVKDLERRSGKDLGGGSLTVAAASTQPELPSKPEAKPLPAREPAAPTAAAGAEAPTQAAAQPAAPPQAAAPVKMPYEARKPLLQATSRLKTIESDLATLADPGYRGDKDQLVGRIDEKLSVIRDSLDSAKSLAAEKGVTAHPSFDEVEAGYAQALEKVNEAKTGYAQSKSASAAAAEEVTADVNALMADYRRVQPVFEKAMGSVIYYNDLKTVEDLLAQIEAFEKEEPASLAPKLAAFAAKYGSTREEIDKKADSMGYSGEVRASFPYTELVQGIENVKKTRAVMADDVLRRAVSMKEHTAKGAHDFSRRERHGEIKAWGQTAAALDPDNPRVKEFMSGIEAWIEADTKALDDRIDRSAWPAQADNAPEDAAALTGVLMDFLQKESDKLAAKDQDPRKMLAVVITGPWRVFKKNLLGEPIQYGLPILGTVQLESEKPQNLARVYELTMLTDEFKGVKMAPPFIGSAVGNSYYIRPSALK